MTGTPGSGERTAGGCILIRADPTRPLSAADSLGGSVGTEVAQRGGTFRGSVDRGWRVELFPSRVGTRARLHPTGPRGDPEMHR